MPTPPMSREEAQRTIDVVEECAGEGFPLEKANGKGEGSAYSEAARRLGIASQTLRHRVGRAEQLYGLKPSLNSYRRQAFAFEPLPGDGEPTAEELIGHLVSRHAQRKAHHDASKLRQVAIGIDGPIGLAFFGDTHVDDPGCAWGDLERDVRACRETVGVLAIGCGDHRNNWVGRLMALYANQEVTSTQSLKLIEWLFTQLPWLLNIGGNHDKWGSDHGDAVEVMHRLKSISGLYENDGARLQLNLPSGSAFTMHVRHDFPGHSQFNGAHAMVRETLFGYRDHLLVCGHRPSTAYMPVWHNDPMRLCHGIRCGAYKDFDKYQKEKHFKEENWARSLGATVDPDWAHDPVRFIKPWFSLEEMAEYLSWRRSKWSLGKSAAA